MTKETTQNWNVNAQVLYHDNINSNAIPNVAYNVVNLRCLVNSVKLFLKFESNVYFVRKIPHILPHISNTTHFNKQQQQH